MARFGPSPLAPPAGAGTSAHPGGHGGRPRSRGRSGPMAGTVPRGRGRSVPLVTPCRRVSR
ncbi:Hypothetical protein SCLAV_0092 [Streptomyces clavuligerus]|uniref:Uncharacterized protein n=1 Tax=Streptomyces clavuligerus TaxID=1901 RepID=E2Q608_STRCL|nr:Hypothetical protein SCLAV_0092 [Streptomyces clavuligerus]